MPPAERIPFARRQALIDSLVSSGRLFADLQIPNVAGLLTVVADLRSRQILVSTAIDAPREGTTRGRVSWLLRQLSAAPEALKVEARLAYRSSPLAAQLTTVREDPSVIYPDPSKEIREFGLSLSSNMGAKRDSGRGSFVESVLTASEFFYGEVRVGPAVAPVGRRWAKFHAFPQATGVDRILLLPRTDDDNNAQHTTGMSHNSAPDMSELAPAADLRSLILLLIRDRRDAGRFTRSLRDLLGCEPHPPVARRAVSHPRLLGNH